MDIVAGAASAWSAAKQGISIANNLINPKHPCDYGHDHETEQGVKQCHQREQERTRNEINAEAERKRIEKERDELKSELKDNKNQWKTEKEKYKEEIERLKEEKKEEIQRLKEEKKEEINRLKEEMKEEKLKSANTRSSVCVLL